MKLRLRLEGSFTRLLTVDGSKEESGLKSRDY
jgi:hypothetical protein